MGFVSLGGGGDDEYSIAHFVEITKMFVIQDAFFFGTEPFGRVLMNGDSVHPLVGWIV